MNGTAEDLAQFVIALMPAEGEGSSLFTKPETMGTIFSASSLDEAKLVGTQHGFLKYNETTFGHGGNTKNSSAQFAVVVLTNTRSELDITVGLLDLLLDSDLEEVVPVDRPLPSANIVEGSYLAAQRWENNFIEFIPYLP